MCSVSHPVVGILLLGSKLFLFFFKENQLLLPLRKLKCRFCSVVLGQWYFGYLLEHFYSRAAGGAAEAAGRRDWSEITSGFVSVHL